MSSVQNVNNKLDSKYLLLSVESANTLSKSQSNIKKIMEFLEPLNNDSM